MTSDNCAGFVLARDEQHLRLLASAERLAGAASDFKAALRSEWKWGETRPGMTTRDEVVQWAYDQFHEHLGFVENELGY